MPITTATTISASSFNYIQTNLSTVLKDYYRYSTESFPVTTGMTVLADQWLRLYRDINRCIEHQSGGVGVNITGLTIPAPTGVIKADFCNALELASDQIVINKELVHPSQLAASSLNSNDKRLTVWGSNIRIVTYHDFIDINDAEAFFNTGGYFRVDLSYEGTASNANDTAWVSLLNAADLWAATSVAFYKKSNYDTGIDLGYSDSSGTHGVEITFVKLSNTRIKTEVAFNESGPAVTINILPVVHVQMYRSVDRSTISSGLPPGVPGPMPQASVQIGLETGGEITPEPAPIRNLKISPSTLSYTLVAGTESPLQTVTLTNLGGTANLEVTSITPSSVGVASRIVQSGGFTGYPIIIGPNESYSFQIAYTAFGAGTYNNIITFTSNDTVSTTKNIDVVQSASVPPFDFSLAPSEWNVTVTNNNVLTQLFVINANQSFTSYVASISNYHDLSFGLNTGSTAGPRIQFAPEFLANGTYVTTLSVTVNGLTRTATITMTVNTSASVNLATWKSAAGYYNSCIGLSYDIISGVKYLTVGINGGADGSPVIANGGEPYLSPSNLIYNSDPGYLNGPVMFKPNPPAAWGAFCSTYGVWPRSTDPGPYTEWYRSYKIYAPNDGIYNWEFSVDNYGWFTIDGAVVGDIRNVGDSYKRSYVGSVSLTAGVHILTMYATNRASSGSNPGAIAITITKADDNQQIWSTLNAVRSNTPYIYWSEVYRIPLDRGAFTYQLKNYLIKAINPMYGGGNISDFFGSGATAGSMLSVTDDGFGNLTITMNEKTQSAYSIIAPEEETLISLSYAFYYYTDNYPYTRYTNLETASGQTRYFLGFTSRGLVVTSLRSIPNSPAYPDYYASYQYQPGDGGYDGGGVSPF